MIWEVVAKQYCNSFDKAREERFKKPRGAFVAKTLDQRPEELPPIQLDHLRRLSDATGLLQHATFNVPNFLESFTGHEFPEKERYKQSKWLAWFEKNRDTLDLKANIASAKAFDALEKELADVQGEKRIERLEAFLAKHGKNRRAEKVLARVLNQVAWDKVTAPKGSEKFDAAVGLKYAKRCVELDPHPNYVDTLAEALLASGKIEESAELCRKMLKEHPKERMFLDRLERCEETLNKRKE